MLSITNRKWSSSMLVSGCLCFLLGANKPIDMEKFQEPLFLWMPKVVVIKINGELQIMFIPEHFIIFKELRLQPRH